MNADGDDGHRYTEWDDPPDCFRWDEEPECDPCGLKGPTVLGGDGITDLCQGCLADEREEMAHG